MNEDEIVLRRCGELELLTSPALPVPHGFATRAGGLDFAYGRAASDQQRDRAHFGACAGFGSAPVHTPRQVHGKGVFVVETGINPAETARQEADALVTAAPQVAVGIITADCVPVLLAGAGGAVVAAVHAGWRGTVAGVVQEALAAMAALGAAAEGIVAVVGPCIRSPAYEVGPELAEHFATWHGVVSFPGGPGARPHLDLGQAVQRCLREAGVGRMVDSGSCTFTEAQRYFSYRRQGEAAGRQISAILCGG